MQEIVLQRPQKSKCENFNVKIKKLLINKPKYSDYAINPIMPCRFTLSLYRPTIFTWRSII